MILTKNKLKSKKVKVDDDDEDHYMNFLRFKHLMDRRDRVGNRSNKSTQTEIATNNDKATDTFDDARQSLARMRDFDEVLEPFRLKMNSINNENNQKATQTNAMRDQETEPRVRVEDKDYVLKGLEKACKSKQQQRRDIMIQVYMATLKDEGQTPPDTDEENDRRDRELLASRLVSDMGLTGLQLGLSATSMLIHGAINLYDALQMQQQEQEEADASADASRSIRDEEQAEDENIGSDERSSSPAQSGQDVDEINSSPPITVNSSSASSNEQDVDINDEWMRRGSRSRSSTPERGYPKKK